mgnify:CR=1 FL=1
MNKNNNNKIVFENVVTVTGMNNNNNKIVFENEIVAMRDMIESKNSNNDTSMDTTRARDTKGTAMGMDMAPEGIITHRITRDPAMNINSGADERANLPNIVDDDIDYTLLYRSSHHLGTLTVISPDWNSPFYEILG